MVGGLRGQELLGDDRFGELTFIFCLWCVGYLFHHLSPYLGSLKFMFSPLQHGASERHLKIEITKEMLKGFFGRIPLTKAMVPHLAPDPRHGGHL